MSTTHLCPGFCVDVAGDLCLDAVARPDPRLIDFNLRRICKEKEGFSQEQGPDLLDLRLPLKG